MVFFFPNRPAFHFDSPVDVGSNTAEPEVTSVVDDVAGEVLFNPEPLEPPQALETPSSGPFDWKTIVRRNEVEVLSAIIPEGVPTGINERMSDGTYPLHAAVRLGHAAMVSKLVEAGAKAEQKDWQGLTAYDYAILSKKQGVLEALLPEGTEQVFRHAMGVAETTVKRSSAVHHQARERVKDLQRLIDPPLAVNRDQLDGVHRLLFDGDLKAIELLKDHQFSELQRGPFELTPLHCALLSRNEEAVSFVLDHVSDRDLAAFDSFGFNPLHYAAFLGLSDSLETMLSRLQKYRDFDINEAGWFGHNLGNLAIAANQPKALTVLLQNGLSLIGSGKELAPADLLCAVTKDRDPLAVSKSQYILAGFSLLSLAADQISPEASMALTACSVFANAAFSEQGGLKGQALFWAGEAFSLATRTGLAKVPWLKALVDVCRVASVAVPCLEALGRSWDNVQYETGKAIHVATVNSVILGSSFYRIRDSLSYLAEVGSKVSQIAQSIPTIGQREARLQEGWRQLRLEEEDVQSRERELEDSTRALEAVRAGLSQEKVSLHAEKNKLEEAKKALDVKIAQFKSEVHSGVNSAITSGVTSEANRVGARSGNPLEYLFSFWGTTGAIDGEQKVPARHITFGTTYLPGNPLRDELSKLVNENQKQYATVWDMEHRVVDKSLLEGQCTVSFGNKDCSPYWNKIKVLKDWLDDKSAAKKGDEEWYVMADDDMVVTNMGIDPYLAIDQLRDGQDSSVIVAQDVQAYTGNEQTSVNTGLLFVRRDEAASNLIDEIWKRRNEKVPNAPSYCPTLGVCEKQHRLHEQQALADLLKEQPHLRRSTVRVVPPRETNSQSRGHLALNTFERSGRFISKMPSWETDCFDYAGDKRNPEGAWRVGDWMGQTAGVPVFGWYCDDKDRGKPPGPIRYDKLKNMINQVVWD